MKLTTIFPRKFMYSLKDYKKSKESGQPIISIPNSSSGAISLGLVKIKGGSQLERFLRLMDNLSKRVFRTGLNENTAGGNFRLPMHGIAIDPISKYIYAKFDLKYPTDSHKRFVTFMKSFYHRVTQTNLKYEPCDDLLLNRLVLGTVENISEIDLKAFRELFEDFNLGFATFNKILVMPAGNKNEEMRSVFYFDHSSHEPIIGIENTMEDDESETSKDK